MRGRDAIVERTSSLRDREAGRRTPVYIICSARPQVGKTLIARLLTEFFLTDGRLAAAFDVNPQAPALVDYLPGYTALTSLGNTRGQVALFDQLVTPDGVPKIVDLAQTALDDFIAVMDHIDFLQEARRQSIEPVMLFVIDPHKSTMRAYQALQHRCPHMTLVPVQNEAVNKGFPFDLDFTTQKPGAAPLRLPRLSPALNAIIDRHSFSFSEFMRKPVETTTELHDWIRRVFVEFREFELRLLLADLRSTLQSSR